MRTTGGTLVVNVPNRGVLKFLPDNAVIETPCIVNAAGITPIILKAPPKTVWGLIAAMKNYEQLTVEAAVTGCRDRGCGHFLGHFKVSTLGLI